MTEAIRKGPGISWISVIFSAWHDPAARILNVDLLAVLIAILLPWSTTGVAIVVVLWVIALVPTIEVRSILRSLARPISAFPIALFALAVVGTLWADGPWPVRLHGVEPVAKLLAIPLLLYHFERSPRGLWVFVAFLVSCALLMGLSWVIFFADAWKDETGETIGVPVKNSIDQSQEFVLCIFALVPLAMTLFRQRRFALAAGCVALILGFCANMMFVVLARTALICMLALTILFAVRYLNRGAMLLPLAGVTAIAALLWSVSPYLRQRVEHVAVEYREYKETNRPTSTGQRLAYWDLSIKSFGEAPLFGHGTGSTRLLFDREAAGKRGPWADSISNPHNQTLYVAVQWGALGCIFLFAVWYFHLLLFLETNFVAWVGLVVVVQNVVSSLLNSHLFDFHEGWIYVLGVGVAGGMTLGASRHQLKTFSRRFKQASPTGMR